jgi:hypothetical protein
MPDPARIIRRWVGKTVAQLNAWGLYCPCPNCRADRAAQWAVWREVRNIKAVKHDMVHREQAKSATA